MAEVYRSDKHGSKTYAIGELITATNMGQLAEETQSLYFGFTATDTYLRLSYDECVTIAAHLSFVVDLRKKLDELPKPSVFQTDPILSKSFLERQVLPPPIPRDDPTDDDERDDDEREVIDEVSTLADKRTSQIAERIYKLHKEKGFFSFRDVKMSYGFADITYDEYRMGIAKFRSAKSIVDKILSDRAANVIKRET